MIYQVSGVLTTKHKDFVVLDVNGVGLKIVATTNTIDTFKVKEKIVLHTYLHVREDTLDLYGFSSEDLKDMNYLNIIELYKKGKLKLDTRKTKIRGCLFYNLFDKWSKNRLECFY